MVRDFTTWQRYVGQWTDKTFTSHYEYDRTTDRYVPNPRGPIHHLLEEARELVEAYERGEPIEKECADITILALAIAHLSGFDLGAAVEDKMHVNRQRKWGPPDEHGVCHHVKAPVETGTGKEV